MNSTAATLRLAEPNQLWWTLMAGFLLWVAIMFVFSRLLSAPETDMTQPPPIDAQIIELPEPKPLPQPVVPETRRAEPPVPPKPIAKETVAPRREPVMVPQAPPVDRPVDQAAERPLAKANPAIEPPPAPKPAPQPSATASAGTEHMGAKAIYQPLPKIPDDLRDEAISTVAMARFHIKPDGTANVELIKATSNPRINQLILNTLRTWKFFPALQDGKPAASTQDIKVNIDVN